MVGSAKVGNVKPGNDGNDGRRGNDGRDGSSGNPIVGSARLGSGGRLQRLPITHSSTTLLKSFQKITLEQMCLL